MTLKTRFTGSAALLAATLLLGACGAATVEVTGQAKATLSSPDTTAPGELPGDTAPSTAAPATTVPDSTVPPSTAPTTVPVTAPERSDEAFCAAAGDAANAGLDSVLDPTNPDFDPDSAKSRLLEAMRTIEGHIDAMDRAAPAAIASDMHSLATTFGSTLDALDTSTGFEALLDSMLDMDTTDVAGASERVASYTLEHCGFSLEGTATN